MTDADAEAGLPPQRWMRLDLESGDWTALPDLDGYGLDRHRPGVHWMVFTGFDGTVIVDAATGEVAARLDDSDLGMATSVSPSRDFGVLVITGHTGEAETTGYVIDAASGESWALDPPEDATSPVSYGVSPDGSLLTASSDSASWVAPVEEGAGWVPLSVGRIVDWLWLPETDD